MPDYVKLHPDSHDFDEQQRVKQSRRTWKTKPNTKGQYRYRNEKENCAPMGGMTLLDNKFNDFCADMHGRGGVAFCSKLKRIREKRIC